MWRRRSRAARRSTSPPPPRICASGSYTQAIEDYKSLLDEHPFSEHSEEAELKIGVAQYKDGSCPEASASFTDFQRRHPTSPLPAAGRLPARPVRGAADARRGSRPERVAERARLLSGADAAVPDEPLCACSRAIAWRTPAKPWRTHELDVAEYYERYDRTQAAEIRMLDLVNRYPDTDVAGDALLQLGELYEKQNEPDKAVLAYTAVTYHHPDHEAARAAEQALDRLSPGPPGAQRRSARAAPAPRPAVPATIAATQNRRPKPLQSTTRSGRRTPAAPASDCPAAPVRSASGGTGSVRRSVLNLRVRRFKGPRVRGEPDSDPARSSIACGIRDAVDPVRAVLAMLERLTMGRPC